MRELEREMDMVEDIGNPLDCIEEVLSANDWSFSRVAEDELALTVNGEQGLYSLFFTWHTSENALQFICDFDLPIDSARHTQLIKLINDANKSLWLGHFELPDAGQSPRFRYTGLFRDQSFATGMDQMKDLMDWGLQACEKYFPVFKMLSMDLAPSQSDFALALAAPAGHS